MLTASAFKTEKTEYILWCDVETTGVNPDEDMLLEIAGIFTDMEGNRIGRSFSELVHVPDISKVINMCDEVASEMHYKSGLFADLWNGGVKLGKLDDLFVNWVKDTVDVDSSVIYFGGRSISFDRRVIANNLPKTAQVFSYRSVDMTSITLILSRNNLTTDESAIWVKNADHRALNDCEDCIAQYQNIIRAILAEKAA